jgi:putative transposase
MARQPRFVVPGQPHYLVQRGHNGQPVFVDDDDRNLFLALLGEAAKVQRVPLHAHALLPAEIHLLVMPMQAESLSRMMQMLGRRYVSVFNRRHGRSGTLWEGRFRTAVLESGPCTLACMQVIDSLEWRRGLASTLEGALWSSTPHRLGGRRNPMVSDPPEFWRLGNTPFEREAAYRALLVAGVDAAAALQLDKAALAGRAWGSDAYLSRLSASTGRSTQAPRRGRPTKAVSPA